MPSDTNTENTHAVRDLYQLIMEELEPDLLLENLPLLMRQSRDESAEEHESRKERYALAFTEAFRRIDVVLAEMKKESVEFRETVMSRYQVQENASDEHTLQSLDASLEGS